MKKIALLVALEILILTLIGLILGQLLHILINGALDWGTIAAEISDPNYVKSVAIALLDTPLSQIPAITLLSMLFFAMFGFYLGLARIGSVSISETGGYKPEKPKKEKKKKEKKKEKTKRKEEKKEKEEEAKPEEAEETFVDTGNRCAICGKPIPPGRAICKECEAMLKGEAPTTFNFQGSGQGGSQVEGNQ